MFALVVEFFKQVTTHHNVPNFRIYVQEKRDTQTQRSLLLLCRDGVRLMVAPARGQTASDVLPNAAQ